MQYYIMPATSATKFSSKRKAMAASPQPQSSLSSTKSGIFETIVFTKKILQTTKSGGGPANKRQQSCTSLWSAVGFFFFLTLLSKRTSLLMGSSPSRVRLRFFDHVGHKTMYASSGNKHFNTKSCHHQIYQNYEQPPQTSQNLYFQSHFSVLKIG